MASSVIGYLSYLKVILKKIHFFSLNLPAHKSEITSADLNKKVKPLLSIQIILKHL